MKEYARSLCLEIDHLSFLVRFMQNVSFYPFIMPISKLYQKKQMCIVSSLKKYLRKVTR